MTRPLRVLTVVASLGPGGTSGRILGMAQGLDRQRIDHRILTLYRPQPEGEKYFGTTRPLFAAHGIPIDTLSLRHPAPGTILPPPKRLIHSLKLFGSAVDGLARVVRSEKVDVIDAHMMPSTFIAAVTGKLTGIPVVATEYHIGKPAPVMFWPLAGRIAFDAVDAVVTDSIPRANDLKRWLYRRKEKVRVIPNGIAPPLANATRTQMREHFGIRDHEIVVTQVSTLQPHKGHGVLLAAASLVLQTETNVRFLIIGFTRGREKKYQEELQAQALRLGIAHRVFIGPYEGAIGDIWQATDIHAHASLFDSLPNAIIEGMSMKKPAVVTAVGGIPSLVVHEQTGLVVPPNDADAFARALLRLIGDSVFAQRLGDAAYARYRRGYRAEDTARKLEDLFLEIVGVR